MKKLGFNDMHGKGFDSARSESWLWQRFSEGDPDYTWVPEVYEKHGHAWDWAQHERDKSGRFKRFPAGSRGAEGSPTTEKIIYGKNNLVCKLAKVLSKIKTTDKSAYRIALYTIRNVLKNGD